MADDDEKVVDWFQRFSITPKNYYLIVGRFVPENNFEVMIREFMKSKTKKDLVLITDYDGNSFYDQLLEKLHFDRDDRIKFVGTVYDQQLLKKIREEAYGYLHGHSVGGTNPSLLEALGRTDLNLLFRVSFNREAVSYTHLDVYKRQVLAKSRASTLFPTPLFATALKKYHSAVRFSILFSTFNASW